MTTEETILLTPLQQLIISKLLSLRKVSHETGTVTRRAQSQILRGLDDGDLVVIAQALDAHQQKHGW